jgi:hypothetical protein
MKILITAALHDTKETIDDTLPGDFVPRVGDTIYFKSKTKYKVERVVIDYDLNEITVWVKDALPTD